MLQGLGVISNRLAGIFEYLISLLDGLVGQPSVAYQTVMAQ